MRDPKTKIIGVIGVSDPTQEERNLAHELGQRIAQKGWILVNGGLGGVMEESARGADHEGGMIIGLLPGPETRDANPYVTIPIATNMGHGRNVIISHTADALVAVGKGYGTLSEISIGLKLSKKVLSLNSWNVPGVDAVESPLAAMIRLEKL